jgi:hypothetical protein
MVNTTTTSKANLPERIFSGPCGAKDSGKNNCEEVPFNKAKDKVIYT